MNRIDRLQAILTQLQTKKIVTAQQIANRFGISLRTVYRDIRALEQGGVPIGAEAGIGYFLNDGYNLPPVMFTLNEASAIIMASKLLPHFSDNTVNKNFTDALFKIKAVLGPKQKNEIDTLDNLVKVFMGMAPPPQPDNIFISDLQKALINKQVVQITYFSNYNQTQTTRVVEPITLLFYAMKWHLIAFCRMRNQYRDFRLDRISQLSFTGQTFDKIPEKAFNEYFENEKNKTGWTEITIETNQTQALAIAEQKYWYGFVNQTQTNNTVTLNFINPDITGFAKWIITAFNNVRVIKPTELNNTVIGLVKTLAQKYL